MTKEELIKFLEENTGKKIRLKMKGIITTTIQIEKMKVKYEDSYLCFSSEVKLNLHQLIKISKIKENEILLEFDQLQNVTIIIE